MIAVIIIFTIVFGHYFIPLCVANNAVHSVEFNVQPGGQQHTFSEKYNGIECVFTYISQGGTNEKWAMVFREEGPQKTSCSVERSGGQKRSYLFFQSFSMVLNGNVEVLHAMPMGNSGELKESEYTVDSKKKSISQVDGKFKSELTQVTLVYTSNKSDL